MSIHPKSLEDHYETKEAPSLAVVQEVQEVNASGHEDKLKRHYGLFSISSTAVVVDSAWIGL